MKGMQKIFRQAQSAFTSIRRHDFFDPVTDSNQYSTWLSSGLRSCARRSAFLQGHQNTEKCSAVRFTMSALWPTQLFLAVIRRQRRHDGALLSRRRSRTSRIPTLPSPLKPLSRLRMLIPLPRHTCPCIRPRCEHAHARRQRAPSPPAPRAGRRCCRSSSSSRSGRRNRGW